MKIAYAAAEFAPLAKVGGLADVAGALTKELIKAGHEVYAFLPLYPTVATALQERLADPLHFAVQLGDERARCDLYCVKSEGWPHLCLIGNDTFFDRQNPYVNPVTGKDWADNAERFIFFSKAILEACKRLGFAPDVLHLNDYQTALAAAFLRDGEHSEWFSQTAVFFSIHNLGYQGIFPLRKDEPVEKVLDRIGLGSDVFRAGGPLEFYGRVNFMKAGIWYADLIGTVSPTYAREIQEPENGFGLDGLLRSRSERIVGILNGIDTEVWDPRTDPHIPRNYGPSDFEGKQENRDRLLESMHLPEAGDAPTIGMISRLVDQKGLDLFSEVAEVFLRSNDVRFVVLGTGLPRYEAYMKQLAERFPGKMAVRIGFDETLAHLIEAGSDFFLMPSRYEPCGLNQMYSMRYGTVPIVRATGGLADTVAEFDARTGRGTGIVFERYEPDELLSALSRAVSLYGRKAAFRSLVVKIMGIDFSWAKAAKEYERAYERALDFRRGAGSS